MPPRPVLVFDNPDKANHEKSDDPLVPSWPFRLFCCGPPGSGKRVQLLNVVAALPEWPDRITVIHLDPETQEYDDLDPVVYGADDLPDFSQFDREERNLLIIDELDIAALNRSRQSSIERLFGHGSTHRNTSIILCYQSFHKVPPAIRRACNNYILFKSVDAAELTQVALRIGAPKEELAELFKFILRGPHDSLFISMEYPPESVHRYRLNLWTPIARKAAKK